MDIQYDIKIGGADTSYRLNLKKRIRIIRKYIEKQDTKILDLGCGEGGFVIEMRKQNLDAQGIDYEIIKIKKCHLDNPGSEAYIRVGDIQNLQIASSSYDVAITNEVLEHIPDESAALMEIHRILKPGGLFISFSPNRFYPFETHGVYMKSTGELISNKIPFIPYIPLSIGSKIFRYWARNYWPWELKARIISAGFTIVSHGYIWPTFEQNFGNIGLATKVLRFISALFEKVPLIKRLGVSQVIIAKKN